MASRKIEDLHITLQPMTRSLLEQGQEAIKSTGWTFFITDGFRSNAEQTKLYSQGRTTPGKIVTNARAGQSAHNYGLAVDMAFQKSGKLSYDPSLYAKIYPIARKIGFELGADWTGFTDKPHFEHPQWEKISNKGKEVMPTALQECLKQHDTLVTDAVKKDVIITSLNKEVVTLEKAGYSCGLELSAANLRIKELEKPKPVEAVKDPVRYVVSLAIGGIITWAYTQFPFLGQIGIDQQVLVASIIGLVVKGLDKYQFETGSKLKLPF